MAPLSCSASKSESAAANGPNRNPGSAACSLAPPPGGIATDLYYHRLTALEVALGPSFPERVSSHGGVYVHKDREVPDTYATVVSYADRYVALSGSTANRAGTEYLGPAIYGHRGTIRFEPGAVVVEAEREFLKEFRERADGADRLRLAVEPEELVAKHLANFERAIRGAEKPAFDAHFGYQAMAAIGLGVEAYRTKRTAEFERRG